MATLQSIQINWFSASVYDYDERFDLEQKIKNFYFLHDIY